MWKEIGKATLIAGILDLSAACIQVFLVRGTTPDRLLKYIASGLFNEATDLSNIMQIIIGLIVHFFIVFCCALIYFLSYPKLNILRITIFLNALLIALIAWTVTTQIIIPLSEIQKAPFHLGRSLVAISILYFCIGLPIAYLAQKYYDKNPSRSSILKN